MKRIFIDTNVFIDFIAHRREFYEPAAILVSLARNKKINLLVSSLSFATASYILQSHHRHSHEQVVCEFEDFITLCHITSVSHDTITQAISSVFVDIEDAIQHYSALSADADYIVTRNKADFSSSAIPVYSPQEILDVLINA